MDSTLQMIDRLKAELTKDRELLEEIRQTCTNYDWLERHDLLILIALIAKKIQQHLKED
jgi:hypothetical protein